MSYRLIPPSTKGVWLMAERPGGTLDEADVGGQRAEEEGLGFKACSVYLEGSSRCCGSRQELFARLHQKEVLK